MLVLWLVLYVASPRFREFYRRAAPLLVTLSRIVGIVFLGTWTIAVAFVGFTDASVLAHTTIWMAFAGSFVALNWLLWIDGPIWLMLLAGAFRFVKGHWSVISKVLLVLLSANLVGFTWYIKRKLPARGAVWSVSEMAVRLTAIFTAVILVMVVLAVLLPRILNVLERSGFSGFVGARHVRSEKSGFLTVISILSICGVAISTCALCVVVSVMGGFREDLTRKILGNNAQMVVDRTSREGFTDWQATLANVRKAPHVLAATPVVHGEVMVSSASNIAGVVVRGVDPATISEVIDLGKNVDVGKFEYLTNPERLLHLAPNEIIGTAPDGQHYVNPPDLALFDDSIDPAVRAVLKDERPVRPGVIVGRELAKTLHVLVGDEVSLVSPLGDLGPMGILPRTRKFRIAAVFYSGMYEYDASHAYILLPEAQSYFATGDKITAIDVKVDDADKTERMVAGVVAAVGREDLRVRDWREMNKNLFSALKLERLATFIILSIAIMVASFCIVCTLLLVVTEKGKEIAILKALGAADGAILRTFMLEGIIIGGIGTVFGVVSALALCTGLSWFGLRLDPEVYYLDRLPVSVNGWDFSAVAGAALVICTLATLYPARTASKLRPVDGLRYE